MQTWEFLVREKNGAPTANRAVSTAATGDDDLKPVAFGQQGFGMTPARHNFTIFFNGDAFAGVAQRFDELGYRQWRREMAILAVDS